MEGMLVGGCIHLFFEGYFALNHARMAGMQDLFGQLWKEYALSDSRYLTSDPFVLCMETVTAVWVSFLLFAFRPDFVYPISSLAQLYRARGVEGGKCTRKLMADSEKGHG